MKRRPLMAPSGNSPAHAGSSFFARLLTPPADRRAQMRLVLRLLVFGFLLILFFRTPPLFQKTSGGIIHLYKKRILGIPLLAAAMILLPLSRRRLPDFLQRPVSLLLAAGIPFLAVHRAEAIQGFRMLEISRKNLSFNILLVLAFFLACYAVIGRVYGSVLFAYSLVVLFALLNHYVYLFRGEPIHASDLYAAGTALNVAADYVFTVSWRVYAALLEWACVFSLLHCLPKETPLFRGKARLFGSLGSAAAAALILWVFTATGWPAGQDVRVTVFKPMKSYERNGQVLNIVRSFYYLIVEKPEGYSEAAAASAMADTGLASDSAAGAAGAPNIIVIMNESLADFSSYGNFGTSEDPLPFLHELQQNGGENVITGNLYLDVFGGRTANSEYEALTGNSISFLPDGAVPYALYVKDHAASLVWNMRAMGFSGGIAFHPYKKDGYSRPRAYPGLGFTDFVAIEDIRDHISQEDFLRNLVSDSADFREVCRMYEETKAESEAPFFLFNVTIQNHGGYSKAFDNLQETISLNGELNGRKDATRYINLTAHSDAAFREITAYFEQVDEPTILVMFGDHQPSLRDPFYPYLYGQDAEELSGTDLLGRYRTPLVIWANYDINPGGSRDSTFADISVNYLSAALTELAGLPLTGYQKFLLQLRREIPVFTLHGCIGADGSCFGQDAAPEHLKSLIGRYQTFQYYSLFEKNKTAEDFFFLAP